MLRQRTDILPTIGQFRHYTTISPTIQQPLSNPAPTIGNLNPSVTVLQPPHNHLPTIFHSPRLSVRGPVRHASAASIVTSARHRAAKWTDIRSHSEATTPIQPFPNPDTDAPNRLATKPPTPTSTILRVESKNDFNATIPHSRFSNHNSTTRKRIREAAAESYSSWSLGEYAVSIRPGLRSTASLPPGIMRR